MNTPTTNKNHKLQITPTSASSTSSLSSLSASKLKSPISSSSSSTSIHLTTFLKEIKKYIKLFENEIEQYNLRVMECKKCFNTMNSCCNRIQICLKNNPTNEHIFGSLIQFPNVIGKLIRVHIQQMEIAMKIIQTNQ
jgi:hypothetical protein